MADNGYDNGSKINEKGERTYEDNLQIAMNWATVTSTDRKSNRNTVTIKNISCNVVQINDRVFQGAKKLKTVKLGKYAANIGKG